MHNLDRELNFNDDYQFILDHQTYVPGRDYIADNNRFLSIIEKYENLDTKQGKYFWIVGHAYYYLQRKQYRQGTIKNFEKYLKSEPFVENYKDTMIPFDKHLATKLPISKQDLEFAELIHFRDVYYLLAKTYQQENILDKAMYYLEKGMAIVPSEKVLFYWELYEVCRKLNNLLLFLQYCNQLNTYDKNLVKILISRANDLIERGYIYKPRKSN